MIEAWQVAESTQILRSSFMAVRRDSCTTPDGSRKRDYFALELKDFAVVVAVTPRLELLLVREYKHGARGVMRTLPAGFIEPGESPEQGARRELLEETGYSAPTLLHLASFVLVPDLSSSRGYMFFAPNAEATSTPHPDADEDIEIDAVPVDRILDARPASIEPYLSDASSLLALNLARPHLAALRGRS